MDLPQVILDTAGKAGGSLIDSCPIVGALLIISLGVNGLLGFMLYRARKQFTDYLLRKEYSE